MTDDKFETAIEYVLDHEGAKSNNPHDRGGATIFGIASASWPEAYAEVMEVYKQDKGKAIEVAKGFYRQYIWDERPFMRIEDIDVATLCFDLHVNHSWRAAGRIVQRACNVLSAGLYDDLAEDGWLGPKTVKRLNALSKRYYKATMAGICGERYRYYRSLVAQRRDQQANMRGWVKRCYPPEVG